MKLNHITDIFFDLDHTLWDFDRNSALTFERIFKINNIDVDILIFLSHYETINLNYWKLYREEKIEREALRFGRLNDAFNAMGKEVDTAVIDKLADDYLVHLTQFNHLFHDTIQILEYLKPLYHLHIITNGFHEIQQGKLTKSNIHHYFKTVTNSEMVGVKKPNSKIFNHALELANTVPEKSLMIGDNYEADILGAKNVGMDVIFYDMHNTNLSSNISQINNLLSLKMYL
ncbi:YjjG family noncanonical pyrimidine nucleotidase [Changchengzhania lutea]|uniref:YjjG family noncanonical pyrimidine nucleotidase n=1 Tax=Changchengzhania lutea TaxID=2049305 RepID=UPI00115F2FB7|nr:YjjG family noncanonical pyrimidine nucleotidase [Changchengzhania lutea]